MPKLIVVRDSDDYVNAVYEPPKGMKHQTAMNAVGIAIDAAKAASEDWTYDDVHKFLKKKGFVVHKFDELNE